MAVIPSMTFRQLQTFRAVMRSGSISEASRALGRTQPAVSAMVAGLERDLGFALFEREHGRLVARPEAHYLLEEAEAVLDRLGQAARTMGEIGRLERGRLRIACHPAASGFFLPRLLARFLAERPGLDAALMMRSSAVVEELIASQDYDIGLAETPEPRPSVVVRAFDLECLLAVPAGDPLAGQGIATPADLDGRAMATLFDEHPTLLATRAAFAAAGATLRRRFVLRTFLPALELVAAGLCVCLTDRITAAGHAVPGVAFIRFAPRVASSVAILTPAHRPPSRLSQAFACMLDAELAALHAPPG